MDLQGPLEGNTILTSQALTRVARGPVPNLANTDFTDGVVRGATSLLWQAPGTAILINSNAYYGSQYHVSPGPSFQQTQQQPNVYQPQPQLQYWPTHSQETQHLIPADLNYRQSNASGSVSQSLILSEHNGSVGAVTLFSNPETFYNENARQWERYEIELPSYTSRPSLSYCPFIVRHASDALLHTGKVDDPVLHSESDRRMLAAAESSDDIDIRIGPSTEEDFHELELVQTEETEALSLKLLRRASDDMSVDDDTQGVVQTQEAYVFCRLTDKFPTNRC